MKKILSITLTVTCAVWMAGFAYLPVAGAATILEGDIVSPDAEYVDDDGNTYYPYDVFIVKYVGDKMFKRLVLNPEVFESYEHLVWGNIKVVTVDELKAFSSADAVRADGDEKVYKLFPDGDAGTKRWVETLDCFNSEGYDWDSVYLINTTDRDNYATGSTMCGGDVVEGDITLSLASDNPVASTIPQSAEGVTFLSVKVTGSGTINQLTFKRLGAGDVDDFGDIYVYENGVRLTSGRSLSSSTSEVSFINLGLQAPTTFQLLAGLTGSPDAGNVNYFAIESASDVTSGAAVGGTFPLEGNPMGTSGASVGTATVTRAGAASRNVTIGEQEVEISQFKISVATEGGNVHRVQLFNNGTAENTKITNLKLKDNTGVTVATATEVGDDGYVALVFDESYYIKKGDSEIFRLYADIGAVKPDRTILLYIELQTDVLVEGNIYGYSMDSVVTAFDGSSSDEYVSVTCKGGDLTLNRVGPNANKIGTDTDDTVFLEYTMSAAADITIKRTRLVVCEDTGATGTYNAMSTNAGADITDIKIVDKDTGTVVAGPKDGTSFDDGTNTSCPGGIAGMYEDFTDTIDLVAGNTSTYQITADIDVSASDSGSTFAAGDIIKFILDSYASLVGTSGTVNYMKYAGTSDAVDDSAIVPSGDIAGEEMTIEAASLTVTLAASPSGSDADGDEKTYIAGQSGVEGVGLIFEAGTASDVTINSVQLTAYILEATGGTWGTGIDTNYVKDTISIVYIYDDTNGGLVTGSTGKGFTSGSNFENTDFNGLDWTISAGESYTMMITTDISSAAPASASTVDTWISFDIADVSADISAVDKDGNSVTATGDAANGGTSPNTDFGIADYGSLTIDQASDTPDKSLVVMGSDDNEVSKFKLTGTNEAWNIEKFSVLLNDGQESGEGDLEDRDNFSGVSLKYQTESQWGSENWTISTDKTFGANASLAFSFSGADRIYVPKDDDGYVTVLVDVEGYDGGTGAKSKKAFKMIDVDGSSSSLLAYGAQSGKQLVAWTTDSAAHGDLNLHFVTRSKPVFAKGAWSGAELELARFTITAEGGDVFFDGTSGAADVADLASACLKFDVVASSTGAGASDASGDLFLYDWNENIVASIDDVTWGNGSAVVSVSFVFEEKDVTIPSGTTKELHIDVGAADLADFVKTDEYIYLQLRNDDGGNLATGSMAFGQRDIVWDDLTNEEGISIGDEGGDPEERFGMPALIKNVGPLPITFRTLRGTAAP
ncbi:MAG: hypothetical protein ACTSQB_00485 [Candidatus Heimdallarchaeota archaeon]